MQIRRTLATVRRMKRAAILVIIGCSGPAKPPVAQPLPAASTTCYAGLAIGMGQRARTVAKRTVDPAAGQIIEDVSHDDAGAHGARSFHVVMKVSGDQFTMEETSGAFTGSGSLAGDPWRWTSWSSTSQIPKAGIEVSSDDELTPKGMKATKEIKKDGKVLATTTEELATFDCANWDKAVAELAVPALDAAACERACRNYATLRYWAAADAEIAQRPAAERDAVRRQKTEELAAKLEAGLGACTDQCVAANNAVQTACMAGATTVDAASACNQD
jgi:hypothetical protein